MEVQDLLDKKGSSFAYQLYDELKIALRSAAKILGVKPEEVYILEKWSLDFSYMNHHHTKDIAKKSEHINDLPFISAGEGLHKNRLYKGRGLVLHEARDNPKLKYVIYHCNDASGNAFWFLFVAKGKLLHLKRHTASQNRKTGVGDPPILEEGLLDRIIANSVGFLINSKNIKKYNVKIKRGILLDGPPGNGKTMVCRYIQQIASSRNISWSIVTASDIDEAYEKSNLQSLFNHEGITFFDDIDISYLNRRGGRGNVACSILTSMDGLIQADSIVRIFTTNEPIDHLDAAFMRPGRVDCIFRIDKPSYKLKARLIDTWHEEIKANINKGRLLEASKDFSFVDLEAIKTYLVMNKLNTENWDLNYALEQFNLDRKIQKKSKKPGFNYGDQIRS